MKPKLILQILYQIVPTHIIYNIPNITYNIGNNKYRCICPLIKLIASVWILLNQNPIKIFIIFNYLWNNNGITIYIIRYEKCEIK